MAIRLNTTVLVTAEDKSYIPLESSLDPALHLLQHEPVSKSASIHSGIIPIWSLILKTGLTEDAADTLVTKYPPATNCPLMAAPKLNSEIVASVNETALRRLFRVEEAQTMMGASLSALGQAITEIINKSVSKTRLLTLLGDAASLIAAVHYRNTAIRRQIMKSQLRCEILDTLDKTSDDSFLFGGNRGAEVESSEGLKKFAQPNGFTGNNGASKNYKEQSGSPSKKRRQRERKRSYPNCKEDCERER